MRVLIAALIMVAGVAGANSAQAEGIIPETPVCSDQYACPTTTTTSPSSTACRYNGNVPADDPTCPPPCEYNVELAADDPYCEPPATTTSTTIGGTLLGPTTTTTLAPGTTTSTSSTVEVGEPPVVPQNPRETTVPTLRLPVTGRSETTAWIFAIAWLCVLVGAALVQLVRRS